MELGEHFSCVLLSRESIHDLKFCKLDVDRVVILAKEDLDIVLEDRWSPLDNEQDISQRHVLDFRTGRKQCNYKPVSGGWISHTGQLVDHDKPNGGPIFLQM